MCAAKTRPGRGLAALCQDVSGFCVETPRPNPAAPISVPENFTPDEEGFWWLADATVPNAGIGLARFAKEAAFDTAGINQGHQVEFARIRFRFGGLAPGPQALPGSRRRRQAPTRGLLAARDRSR